jgi:hypothetical protein
LLIQPQPFCVSRKGSHSMVGFHGIAHGLTPQEQMGSQTKGIVKMVGRQGNGTVLLVPVDHSC